jgi:hypothetical protein
MCFVQRPNIQAHTQAFFLRLNRVINLLMLYTFENGLITWYGKTLLFLPCPSLTLSFHMASIGAVMSLIFWLTTPRDLVFFGIHFVISKRKFSPPFQPHHLLTNIVLFLFFTFIVYANSLLVALNTRRQIRRGKWSMTSCTSTNALPVLTPINFSGRGNNRNSSMQVPQMGKPVQVGVFFFEQYFTSPFIDVGI